jgi:hypothetical protein
MTARTGIIEDSFVYFDVAISSNIAPIGSVDGFDTIEGKITGSLTRNTPVEIEPQQSLTGAIARMFVEDFYNRYHYNPSPLTMGFIPKAQDFTVELWNGYRADRNIDNVDDSALGRGIDTASDVTYIGPWDSATLTLSVSMTGPGNISGNLVTIFVNSDTAILAVTGSRLRVIPIRPANEITESLSWLTDVLTSRNGREQRIQLRQNPRRKVSFNYWVNNPIAQGAFDADLWKYHGQSFGVPLWQQARSFSGPLSSGSTTISCDTTNAEFAAEGRVFVWQDNRTYEALVIDSFTDTDITLKDQTTENFTANTLWIMPLVTGALGGRGAQQDELARHAIKSDIEFEIVDLPSEPSGTTPSQYNSLDILYDLHTTGKGSKSKFDQEPERIDNESGKWWLYNSRDIGVHTFDKSYVIQGKANIWQMIYWIYRRKGKLVPFYAPTWRKDVTIYGTVGAGSANVDIYPMGFAVNYTEYRDHLLFHWNDGTKTIREVLSVTDNDDYETLVLDSALGVEATDDDFKVVTIFRLCRLDSDTARIVWRKSDIAQFELKLTEIKR